MSIVQILFQNKDFVICDKKALTLSTPDRHKSDRPCLGLELQRELGMQIFPVHRLDFEVSGVIMYATNTHAHKASQDWFQKKLIQKKYKALTLKQDFSHWPENVSAERQTLDLKAGVEFFWKMKILRGKRRSFESAHGDCAETKAVFHGFRSEHLEWDMYPITGRAHQLRLELSRHGFPILGDELYGSKFKLNSTIWPYGAVALRAIEIQFGQKISEEFQLPLTVSATYV
jgi:tRNA pseudouridine32 synthase / 23S rRNA pseudouridine746 synthase